MDPEKSNAVEKHAESEVYKYLEDLGYTVEKFGKPFDFLATKGLEKVKVEVKGKQDFAVTVEVTTNEVEVAKNLDGTHRTLLSVVDGIELTQMDGIFGRKQILIVKNAGQHFGQMVTLLGHRHRRPHSPRLQIAKKHRPAVGGGPDVIELWPPTPRSPIRQR
jgi:hypothetical protein